MVYAPFTRITFSGDLGPPQAPVEHFSFGLSIDPGPLVTDAVVAGAVAAANALFSRGTTEISSQCRLKRVKVSSIDAAGHLIGNSREVAVDTPGGSGSAIHPPQVAWVVSLGTGQRGASKRGRFFLPMPAVGLGTDLEVPAVVRGDAEASVVTFLNDINAAFSSGHRVVIASRKGYNTPVTTVRMGRALDTLRSRRRSLSEQYDAGTALA